MKYDIIVIGAGASGLFFGALTELNNCSGLILEKTSRPGTKLLMSGAGQCNITQSGNVKDFIGSAYGKAGKSIRSILYKHSNLALVDFFERNGIETYARKDGKVFPASMKSRDVRDMLVRRTMANGFEIKCGYEVIGVEPAGSGTSVTIVCRDADGRETKFIASTLVIATGGCSYPETGSDGSMFDILKRDLGIGIIPPRPALSPIQVREYPYESLAGISFPEASVTIGSARTNDALLFTHRDFSGPGILNISKYASAGDTLRINYLNMTYEAALSLLKSESSGRRKSLTNIIAAEFGVPKQFASSLTDRYGQSLKALTSALTGETFTIAGVSGWNRAMVTAGGVSLSELDLKTMKLKNHPHIRVIGEACDVDGITGGYNIQFAYSSAAAASVSVTGQ